MFEINGLNELQKELENLQKKVENLSGSQNIPLKELLSNSFMKEYTSFNSISELFKASGFQINSIEDFDNIPSSELDRCTSKNTDFDSWQDIIREATNQYVLEKLDF